MVPFQYPSRPRKTFANLAPLLVLASWYAFKGLPYHSFGAGVYTMPFLSTLFFFWSPPALHNSTFMHWVPPPASRPTFFLSFVNSQASGQDNELVISCNPGYTACWVSSLVPRCYTPCPVCLPVLSWQLCLLAFLVLPTRSLAAAPFSFRTDASNCCCRPCDVHGICAERLVCFCSTWKQTFLIPQRLRFASPCRATVEGILSRRHLLKMPHCSLLPGPPESRKSPLLRSRELRTTSLSLSLQWSGRGLI